MFLVKILNKKGFVVLGDLKFSKQISGDKVAFGTKMTETSDPIFIYVGSQTATAKVDSSRILTLGKSPVFLIDQ